MLIVSDPLLPFPSDDHLAWTDKLGNPRRASLVISHRFSTVRMADRIIVLERGRIIDDGSHLELMARRGLYAELFELQAAGYQ